MWLSHHFWEDQMVLESQNFRNNYNRDWMYCYFYHVCKYISNNKDTTVKHQYNDQSMTVLVMTDRRYHSGITCEMWEEEKIRLRTRRHQSTSLALFCQKCLSVLSFTQKQAFAKHVFKNLLQITSKIIPFKHPFFP